jgi:hypothetical protein
VADHDRRERALERAKRERRTVGELVGDDDLGLELVEDRRELCGDGVRAPEQVVEPLLGLVPEGCHGPFAGRGEEGGELLGFLHRLVAGSNQARVAPGPEGEQAVLEAVGGDSDLQPYAGRDDDVHAACPQRPADRRERKVVRGVVGADEQGDHGVSAALR